jgi:coproporphyrinogen III oxidase
MTTASVLSRAAARVRGGVAATRATARPPSRTPRSARHVGFRGFRNDASRARGTTRLAVASSDAATTDLFERIDTNGVDLDAFEVFVVELQASVCAALERIETEAFEIGSDVVRDASATRPAVFREDAYARSGTGSGFGVTRVMEGGGVFEKAAANVSVIRGTLSPERAAAMSARGRPGVDPRGGQTYAAAALSLVFHPRSPMVPTFRADVRRFTVDGVGSWYGGGADLTPYYLFDEDAAAFHAHYRNVCAAHDATAPSANRSGALHARCKKWCDEYFYIPARGEHRGVGGVFFDDMSDDETGSANASNDDSTSRVESSPETMDRSIVDFDREASPRDAGSFTRAVGLRWIDSYEPIVKRRWSVPYDAANEKWHHQRRGRYVEFNLLYDRGVRFGLDGGRVESIMVSAPPRVRWDYDVKPAPGSEEARLVETLRNTPKEW